MNVIGIAANAVNAAWYFSEGDIFNGICSGLAALPGIGGAVGKIGSASRFSNAALMIQKGTQIASNVGFMGTGAYTIGKMGYDNYQKYVVRGEDFSFWDLAGDTVNGAFAVLSIYGGAKGLGLSKTNSINTSSTKMYRRKGYSHRNISENGFQIIDKPTYNKITKPAIRKGANIQIADAEWTEHLRKEQATAVTIGDNIIFSKDATVSDVLEEVYHFYQNKRGLNNQYNARQRTIMNEIDAKQYLLSVTNKYHIPTNEVELTQSQLEGYIAQMIDMQERGLWE